MVLKTIIFLNTSLSLELVISGRGFTETVLQLMALTQLREHPSPWSKSSKRVAWQPPGIVTDVNEPIENEIKIK